VQLSSSYERRLLSIKKNKNFIKYFLRRFFYYDTQFREKHTYFIYCQARNLFCLADGKNILLRNAAIHPLDTKFRSPQAHSMNPNLTNSRHFQLLWEN